VPDVRVGLRIPAVEAWEDYRFLPHHIEHILGKLNWPDIIHTEQRDSVHAHEVLLIVLARLAWPVRECSLGRAFGRSKSAISRIFHCGLQLIYTSYWQKVYLWTDLIYDPVHLQVFVDAINTRCFHLNGHPMIPPVFALLDGTLFKTTEPVRNQRAAYMAHKHSHGWNYQVLVLPNGMIAGLYGPIPAFHHDSFGLWESGYDLFLGPNLPIEAYVLTDSAYGMAHAGFISCIKEPKTPADRAWNDSAHNIRGANENIFATLYSDWVYLDFPHTRQIGNEPLHLAIVACVFFFNCKTCLYGNNVSQNFGVNSPHIDTWLC
jgi:hypothetical protein